MSGLYFILIYDAWLYWSHRLLHIVWLRVHQEHHAKYTHLHFHVVEHVILWGPLVITPLISWTFALGVSTAVLFATLAIHKKVYNWLNLKYGGGLEFWITPRFHLVHHQKGNCNYSLFLTHWDYICKTRITDSKVLTSKEKYEILP